MLTVAEALAIVLENVQPLSEQPAALDRDVLGLLLAEDVASDLDMPPFDKAMMDGFAVRTADLRGGRAELAITDEILAGKMPTRSVGAGEAARIMTGAPVPRGADVVVMIERCELLGDRVRIDDDNARPGKNILPRGKEMREGEVVLHAGSRIRPQELGLLAAVGRTQVRVQPRPRVAILSTGDEIVEPGVKPGPSQIRNSNGMMLVGQTARAGAVPHFCGIAPDEPAKLKAMIAEGLRDDVLLLSGGVSAGKLDLVPGILQELGVQALFHKVSMKPGKPVLFAILPSAHRGRGAGGEGESPPRVVFGLPGNPISSLVCFELFVRPALRRMLGLRPGPEWVKATLTQDGVYKTDRPTYHPAILQPTPSGWTVAMVSWFGSPDLRGVTAANAFALLSVGDHTYRTGQTLDVLRVEGVD